jgi:acetyltransferase-like isoleucine patch superfamily enzyme
MIITHEFFHDHYRTGPVCLGTNVIVGARSIVLAGVRIGDVQPCRLARS